NPGAVYYLVERDGRQIGFASSTADTTPNGIQFSDYLIIEARADAKRRMALSSTSDVSRGFQFKHIEVASDTSAGWYRATADVQADSMLIFRTLFPKPSSHTDHADRVMLAPDVIPMVLGMGSGTKPRVGSSATYRVVDGAAGRIIPITFSVAAES